MALAQAARAWASTASGISGPPAKDADQQRLHRVAPRHELQRASAGRQAASVNAAPGVPSRACAERPSATIAPAPAAPGSPVGCEARHATSRSDEADHSGQETFRGQKHLRPRFHSTQPCQCESPGNSGSCERGERRTCGASSTPLRRRDTGAPISARRGSAMRKVVPSGLVVKSMRPAVALDDHEDGRQAQAGALALGLGGRRRARRASPGCVRGCRTRCRPTAIPRRRRRARPS
jgi:hypothetical protein